MQIVGGALSVGGGCEDEATVVLQDLQPVLDVGGVVLARRQLETQIRAEEGRAKFGDELFLGIAAVGGTNLKTAANTRGWTEAAWSGAGSGCSSQISKPSWQKDTACSRRTVADVSAVADPNTGVAVFYANLWWTVGGTSASSPIVASVYALAGNASTVNAGSYPYSHTTGLYDVTSGSNGTCSPSYLCHGQVGYDGPTGLGTPNGVSGF